MKLMVEYFSKLIILMITIGFAGSVSANTDEEKEVVAFVDKAVQLLNEQGESALATIGKTDGDFHNGSKYVFVYDDNVVMLAHPVKPKLVGRSYKGKPDVKGKKFRDEIVRHALNGGGWTEYVYQKPGTTSGLFKKKVYSSLAENGGRKFIVASGTYAGSL
ncbi:MAG: cache domain-containing protein [Motiliproteus sp.]